MSTQTEDGNGRLETVPEQVVDPAEVDDDQDGLIWKWKRLLNQMGGENKGPDTNKIIDQWLPEHERWHGKTDISLNQARPIAVLSHIDELFPNIVEEGDEYDIMAKQVVNDKYLELLTSWEGKSREQQVQVLQNLGNNEEHNVQVGAPPDDDDDD